MKDRPVVELVDLPLYGRAARLVWHKRRWTCPDPDCAMGSWTEGPDDIAACPAPTAETITPDATLVADPFHVCKLANTKLDECRRRVQNETLGHRGRKSDPLYRCRRLLAKAKERLDERVTEKLRGLLRAGDPRGDVSALWQAKEAVGELCAHADAELALGWVTELGHDLQKPARSAARSSGGGRRSPPGTRPT